MNPVNIEGANKWRAQRIDPNTIVVKPEVGETICKISHPHGDKEAESNAILIENAGRLYSALNSFVRSFSSENDADNVGIKLEYKTAVNIIEEINKRHI